MPKKIKITIAKTAGFCFGVRRAIEMTEKALAKNKAKVFSLGPIIHNSQIMKLLENKGLKIVDGPKKISNGSVFIIRSHGIAPEIIKEIENKGAIILDATCPFVKKAQNAAIDFYKKNRTVIICGDPKHAEVIGIKGYAKNKAIVIQNEKEAKKIQKIDKIGILSQTTQEPDLFKNIVKILAKKNKDIEIVNTICLDSSNKKEEVKKLAKTANIMIIVGGKNSNNTKKLAETSLAAGTATYHIETAKEIKKAWLKKVKTVGISAGASTPLFLIEEVEKRLKSL
jgi:(E)-4-hydroxy-3-methyl-but-2-enyl pyrophosphate reductase